MTSIDKNCPSSKLWNKVNKIRAPSKTKTDYFDQSINMHNFLNFHFPKQLIKSFRITKTNQAIDKIFEPKKLKEIIQNKSSKSPGVEGITYDLLKQLPNEYYDCLANCFNEIWTHQTFPEEWKTTKVIPIPKPDKDKNSVEGYRPISLLPVLLKCFNTVVKNRLESHMETIKYIPTNSEGFTPGKSTNDVFYKLNSTILNNKSKKN